MLSPVPEQGRPLRRVEYDQLVALGTFEGERIELIDGALRHMSPIGPPHASTVDPLAELLVLALVGRARIRVQGNFAASELSDPAPDLCVLPLGECHAAHPSQAPLIIEVADSSLHYDRGEEARLDATCGVLEYWVVNLVDRVVEVHREPAAGRYQQSDGGTERRAGGAARLSGRSARGRRLLALTRGDVAGVRGRSRLALATGAAGGR